MEVATSKSRRLRAMAILSGVISLTFSLFQFIQQDGLKSDGTFYMQILGADVFSLIAIVLTVFSVALYFIGRKSSAAYDQYSNAERYYAQYKASSRLFIGTMFVFLLVFIISQIVNHKTGVKSNALSLSAVLFGFAVDLFIVMNVVFYFWHRDEIKTRGERTGLSVWTQVSFFLVNQVIWMYLESIYPKSSIAGMQYVVVPLFFIGILGLIIRIGILRSQTHSIASRWSSYLRNPRRMAWADADCLKNAAYMFVLCIAVIFALASLFMPVNTAM